MRFSLIFGLLFLALVLLAGPYVSGSQVAAWHERNLGTLDSPALLPGLPQGWRVKASELERGWFSSDLQLQLLPPPALCDSDPCVPMAVDSRVHHGPLAFGALPARAAMLPSLAVAVTYLDTNRLLGKQRIEPPLPRARVATRIGLTGQASSQLQLPASEHRLAGDAKWSHEGLSGGWSERNNQLELQANGARYQAADGTELQLNDVRLAQGDDHYKLHLDTVGLSRNEQPGVQLSGLAFSYRSEATATDEGQPELASAQVSAQMQTLRQGERGIGPLELQLNMERLSMDSLRKVRSSLQSIYGPEVPPHLQRLALQGLLLQELPSLTASGPRIELKDFRLGLGEEEISASMDLSLAPQTRSQRSITDFITAIDLAAEMQAPAQVVQLTAMRRAQKKQVTPAEQLEEWLGKGWLIRSGDNFHSSLRLADGRLTINGNESQAWADWLDRLQTQQAQSGGLAGQRNWQQRLITPDSEDNVEGSP